MSWRSKRDVKVLRRWEIRETSICFLFGECSGPRLACVTAFPPVGPGESLGIPKDRLLESRLGLLSDAAIVVGIGAVFATLIADLVYSTVNPRIRCKVREEAPVGPVPDSKSDSQLG